jgi:hypothetical protein
VATQYPMYTSAQGSGSANNNHGVVFHGGNVPSDGPLDSVSLGSYELGFVGSRVVAVTGGDHETGVQKAVTAGTLAYWADRNFIIKMVNSTIGGVSNSSLVGGADFGQRRRVHGNTKQNYKDVVGAIQAGYWNIYGGTWNTPPTAISTYHRSTTNNAVEASDAEVAVSRAVQGEFTYMTNSPNPVSADYDEKTG